MKDEHRGKRMKGQKCKICGKIAYSYIEAVAHNEEFHSEKKVKCEPLPYKGGNI